MERTTSIYIAHFTQSDVLAFIGAVIFEMKAPESDILSLRICEIEELGPVATFNPSK